MGTLSPRFFRSSAPVLLALFAIPTTVRAAGSPDRDVRIAFVEGDVRLSRGGGKHVDLANPWEQAQPGEPAETGVALWTGDGRAEIEFEGTSVVFLAPNSLLLFSEISASHDNYFTRLTLATGTASFALEPYDHARFEIDTPTDSLAFTAPDTLYVRIGAYLDATSVTPIHDQGDVIVRDGLPNFHIAKGRAVFFRNSEVIVFASKTATTASALESGEQLFPVPELASKSNPRPTLLQSPPTSTPSADFADWDSWVTARRFERAVLMNAALNATGLETPIPGLLNLYEHGTFFSCPPYGTCWEPNQADASDASAAEAFRDPSYDQGTYSGAHFQPAALSPGYLSAATPQFLAVNARQNAQTPAAPPSQANANFPPQTVQWEEYWEDECGGTQTTTVSRVARSQQELDKLLRRQAAARNRGGFASSYNPAGCYTGFWIRHHRHYARVITPPGRPPHCPKCSPVHPPRPLWVRVGDKVGIVPRHPNDMPGKPPINLKNGVLFPPSKPGEPLQHLAWDGSLKFKVLSQPPAQFQRIAFSRGAAAAAPVIHAHLVIEPARSVAQLGHSLDTRITYNYKTREFMAPGKALKTGAPREVAIGAIHSNGRLSSFADGRSRSYTSSFYSHSSVASSYNGGRYSYAMNGGSAGGWHGSGGVGSHSGGYSGSGGGGSRGGGSSGGGSSGGGSSGGGHSSGGGASATAGAGGGGGGHAH